MTSLFFAPEDSVALVGVARKYSGDALVWLGIQNGVKELRSRLRNATTKMQDLRLSIFAPLSLLLNGIQNACIGQVKVLPQRRRFSPGLGKNVVRHTDVKSARSRLRNVTMQNKLQLSIYIPLVMQV